MLTISAAAAALLSLGAAAGLSAPPPERVDFARQVRPLLAARCFGCHGPAVQKSGLRLDLEAPARRAIAPGKSAESALIRRVTHADAAKRMPPAGAPLSAAETELLARWIDQGASWESAAGGGAHWSLAPIARPVPPAVRNRSWVRNPVDAFILARLERDGIRPAAEAEPAVLLRRLSYDLTGLPPSPEEARTFLEDRAPGAWERLVDRLLASPHFGERWARHWLDLARYADTDGYGPDRMRPYAWRWRDWVIDALNRDMPFDQFTVEQIAGDLLPGATLAQKTATGFHRNTLSNREAGADQEESRTKAVVDRVNTIGTAWLGMTVGCAECHDHKYDPISQREFYGLYAFFNNADEADIAVPPTPHDAAIYEAARRAYEAQEKDLESDLAAYRARLKATLPEFEQKLRAGEAGPVPPALAATLALAPEARTPRQTAALLEHYERRDGGVARRTRSIEDHRRTEPKPGEARAMVLAQRGTAPRPTALHIRGDFQKPGEAVSPGTPAVLPPLRARGAAPDRLDFARWLADPVNPLPARVQANRVWQHLFGQGLVVTGEDFGIKGEPPSHPELLDWLASSFAAGSGSGKPWSLKALIRLVVTSAAYRQSSAARPELAERDPKNRLLARQNRVRLEAEAIRDGALAAGGLLNRQVGGPSFRPPLPKGVTDVAFRLDLSYTPDRGEALYRRSLYIFIKRNLLNPFLVTFDAPDAAAACSRRARANTPLQALALLNDPLFLEAARGLAGRMTAGAESDAGRAALGFQLCTARRPDAEEARALAAAHADLRRLYAAAPAEAAALSGKPAPADAAGREALADTAAWIALARTLLNLDETITRE